MSPSEGAICFLSGPRLVQMVGVSICTHADGHIPSLPLSPQAPFRRCQSLICPVGVLVCGLGFKSRAQGESGAEGPWGAHTPRFCQARLSHLPVACRRLSTPREQAPGVLCTW